MSSKIMRSECEDDEVEGVDVPTIAPWRPKTDRLERSNSYPNGLSQMATDALVISGALVVNLTLL